MNIADLQERSSFKDLPCPKVVKERGCPVSLGTFYMHLVSCSTLALKSAVQPIVSQPTKTGGYFFSQGLPDSPIFPRANLINFKSIVLDPSILQFD
jgi:hypothetical protein